MADAPAVNPSEPTPIDIHADWPGALLVATGVTCLLHAVTAVGRALIPIWAPSPLLSLVFFVVTLFAFYRHRWIRLYRPYGSRRPIYLAELVLLLVLTRLVPLLATPAQLVALVPQWIADPGTIFTGSFIADAIVVGAAWLLGHTLARAVDQLHLQPGELPPPRGTPEHENWERSEAAFDHRGSYRHVSNHATGGGAIVIATLTVGGMLGAGEGALREVVIATILYFAASLLLMAWAHVSLLDTLWQLDGLEAPRRLTRQWPVWLGVVLVIVALLALLAPRSYAVDPIVLLGWLLEALIVVGQLVVFLITLPIFLVASLLGMGGETPSPPAGPPMTAAPAATGDDAGLPFLELLRSIGFWAITIALVIYSLRTLYQSRWGVMRWLPRFPVLATIARLWRALLAGLRSSAGTLAAALRANATRTAMRSVISRAARPPRPNDPRGLVQFLYLSLIERAARRGYPRRRGMTATEYSHFLAVRLAATEAATPGATDAGSARAELDELTAAFLEARYSRHPLDESVVGRARRAVQHLLALIRRATSAR